MIRFSVLRVSNRLFRNTLDSMKLLKIIFCMKRKLESEF